MQMYYPPCPKTQAHILALTGAGGVFAETESMIVRSGANRLDDVLLNITEGIDHFIRTKLSPKEKNKRAFTTHRTASR